MQNSLDAILSVFQKYQRFLLTTHENPDGDGLGSEIALAEALARNGKVVSILNHSRTPLVYEFLDPEGKITRFDENRDVPVIRAAEVIVLLDANHLSRVRSMEPYISESNAIRICIDHHLDPSPFADHYLLDPDATSTGEIIYRVLVRLYGRTISAKEAEALYCAIMTDTGNFRYPRVDEEVFQISSHLVECGADPVDIFHKVYEQWSVGRMQLLGKTLASMKTACSGRLAYVTITRDILKQTGTSEEDTDNFTTYAMSIHGVVAGILFLELERGVKISFRSRGDIPINELAKEFGGNGHKNAAGARVSNGSFVDIQSQVLAATQKYLK